MEEVDKVKVGKFWVWTCPECGHDNVQSKGVRVIVAKCKECGIMVRLNEEED